jgi:glycosyltransferase involved in cell wall biosynthesis
MLGGSPASLHGRSVVFLNWRDTANPEGGGSERYVERMARGLAERGASVTVFCASHPNAPDDQVVGGVRFVRRGGKMDVYLRGVLYLASRRFGRVDAVVDVQNGIPFFTRLATRRPIVVLVHHVHREQWPIVYPGLMGRVGWWVESRLAPRVYRRCRYVAVSEATRAELGVLGVSGDRVTVVRNGTEPALAVGAGRAPTPTLCVLGRLVPHKRVEHAIEAVVALRDEFPDLRLFVVGSGWWEEDLRKYAAAAGVGDLVVFEGRVSEERKHEILASSWLLVLPSLKEGWGLVVGEAGTHGVPTIAYAAAGGTRESVADGRSGLLVGDRTELIEAIRGLLRDPGRLADLGAGARETALRFGWPQAEESFATVVAAELSGRDPDSVRPARRRRRPRGGRRAV